MRGSYSGIIDIAAAEGLDLGQVSKLSKLTQLAPDIIEACLAHTDHGLALAHLMRRKLPGDCAAQRLKFLSEC